MIKGNSTYTFKMHEKYLIRLPETSLRLIIESQLRIVSELEKEKELLKQLMKKESKNYTIIKEFKKLPEIGDVSAITSFAIILTPTRFSSKRKLWTYCKLGISKKGTGEKVIKQNLNRRGNPLLKCMAKRAAVNAVHVEGSCFKRMYDRLASEGKTESITRISVARKIISTMYFIWLKNLKFDESYRN